MSRIIPSHVRAKKMVMSITSWFCIADQGMKDFEVLCKASAFLVKSNPMMKNSKFKSKYHLLTVSHVVAPWKFPKLYPNEWLTFVNEKHTHFTIELRYEDGTHITQLDLLPKAFLHPTRDLAVLHFEDENQALKMLKRLDLEDNNELLTHNDSEFPLKDGESLQFHGHHVVQPIEDFFSNDSNNTRKTRNNNAGDKTPGPYDHLADDLKVVPQIINGSILGRTKQQIFAKTTPILPDGMCGGPVFISRNINNDIDSNIISSDINKPVDINISNVETIMKKKKRQGIPLAELNTQPKKSISSLIVCGLVEGIVPENHPLEELRGAAVFVESPEIMNFIRDVEEDKVIPLVGGEAAINVGNDFDPAKIDIKNIFK